MPILKCSVLTSDTARRGDGRAICEKTLPLSCRIFIASSPTANYQQNIATEKTIRENKHYFVLMDNHCCRMMMIINKGKGWHWSCCIIQQSFPYPLCQNNHHHHLQDCHLKVIPFSFINDHIHPSSCSTSRSTYDVKNRPNLKIAP